jgi:hypothetical protein
MDTGSALIILGIVAITVLPFIFHALFKKLKDMKFLKSFLSLAEKEKIVISQKELWNNCYIIGIDNNSKKILYTNKRKEKAEEILIDLAEVENCRIASFNKTLKGQSGNSNKSDRLDLVFTFRKSGIPEMSLEFYDSTEFMPTDKENSIIENWLNIVNSNLLSSRE